MPTDTRTTPIITAPFTVEPTVHALQQMGATAEKWWWTAAIPISAMIAYGITDWRWFVVAMAVVFVAFPIVAMTAWFSLLSQAEALRDTYPHTVSYLTDGSLQIHYHPKSAPEAEPADDGHQTSNGNKTRHPDPVHIPSASLTSCSTMRKHIAIYYRTCDTAGSIDKASGILFIPISAFNSPDDASRIIAGITGTCQRNIS